jgi:hypothetical protein
MGYTLNVLGAAIGVRSAVGDAALVTVSEGAGKKSAALIFADKHVEKVKTGFAWSEAVAMDSTSIVANAQKDAGKTFPVVVSRADGAVLVLKPVAGHTAASALALGADGAVYGWSMGRIDGKATYCSVVWPAGESDPELLKASDTEAIGASPRGGVFIRYRKLNKLVEFFTGAGEVEVSTGTVIGARVNPDTLEAVGAIATRLDPDGTFDFQAVRWNGGQTVLADTPDEESCVALGITDGGIAYGYTQRGKRRFAAVFLGGGTIAEIDDNSEVSTYEVHAYSAELGFVGMGQDASGKQVAWSAIPA